MGYFEHVVGSVDRVVAERTTFACSDDWSKLVQRVGHPVE